MLRLVTVSSSIGPNSRIFTAIEFGFETVRSGLCPQPAHPVANFRCDRSAKSARLRGLRGASTAPQHVPSTRENAFFKFHAYSPLGVARRGCYETQVDAVMAEFGILFSDDAQSHSNFIRLRCWRPFAGSIWIERSHSFSKFGRGSSRSF
jgi:hypothetical protein